MDVYKEAINIHIRRYIRALEISRQKGYDIILEAEVSSITWKALRSYDSSSKISSKIRKDLTFY